MISSNRSPAKCRGFHYNFHIETTQPLIFTALELEAKALRAKGLTVQVVGMRACRLPKSFPPASCVIMAGLAGALDPSLKIGDIVMDGKIHTADHCVVSVEEKATLFKQTGAAAVDMENAIVRSAVEAAGLRYIGVRAISDTADESIDPRFLSLIDDMGRPKALAAAGLVLSNPSVIGELRKLQKQSALATEALGRAVLDVVQSLART